MFEENANLLISLSDPKSPVSEAYRVLRTNVQFSAIDKPLKSLVITSAGPGEGKSITVCNTAITFAQAGSRVLVIDGDLRKPKIHKIFGLKNRKGLTNILALHEDYHDYVESGPVSNLDILTSGAIPPNPSELLSSRSMKELLGRISEEYDYVLVDSPPVGVVTDASIISTIVDGTVLVVASRQVEAEALRHSRELLDKVNANIIGVVLNKISRSEKGGYYYYYYYYGSDSKSTRKKKRGRKEA